MKYTIIFVVILMLAIGGFSFYVGSKMYQQETLPAEIIIIENTNEYYPEEGSGEQPPVWGEEEEEESDLEPFLQVEPNPIESKSYDLSDYPLPFIKNGNTNDLLILLGKDSPSTDVFATLTVVNGLKTLTSDSVESDFSSDHSDYDEYDLILIGHPCDNPLSNILGSVSCDDWDFDPGYSIINLMKNGEYHVLVVAGTTANDLAYATESLANFQQHNFGGSMVILKTPSNYGDEDPPEPPNTVKLENFPNFFEGKGILFLSVGQGAPATDTLAALGISSMLKAKLPNAVAQLLDDDEGIEKMLIRSGVFVSSVYPSGECVNTAVEEVTNFDCSAIQLEQGEWYVTVFEEGAETYVVVMGDSNGVLGASQALSEEQVSGSEMYG